MTQDTCSDCGRPVEDSSSDPAERTPCPNCGSTKRNIVMTATAGSSSVSGASANITVLTYPQRLLGVAKGLIDSQEFSIAVVVAHMAAEIAVERSLSRAYEINGLSHLGEAIGEFLNGYNLANEKIRKLFTAVTGNAVYQESFWQAFIASARRRNSIVHGSKTADKQEATASLSAVTELVEHLKQ